MANVKTKAVRLSYPAIFAPKSSFGNDPEYSAVLLIPKSDTVTVSRINDAIAEETENWVDRYGKGKQIPKNFRSPLRDGDEEKDSPEYRGMYFINAKKRTDKGAPKLYCKDGSEAMSEDDIYAGCWVLANLSLFPYSNSGNNGVGVGLEGLKFHHDGERFSGVNVDANSFDDEDDEDMM